MDLLILLKQMAELFIIIALGYLLFKTNIINVEFNKRLTKLILNVTMPAMILSSVFSQIENGKSDNNSVAIIIGFSIFLLYIVLPFCGFIVMKILRVPKNKQGLYLFMTTFSNIGFMGFPIIGSLFGAQAVFYTALVNIAFTIAVFTLGLFLIHFGQKDRPKFQWKSIFTPGILLSILSVIIYLLNIHFPDIIVETTDSLGSVTSPLAMMLIGSTLATMNVKEVFAEWRVYPYILCKQVLIPLCLYPLFTLLIEDTGIRNTIFVLILMPVANNSILFATEYGSDEKLAAKTVFISTVFSLLSIPLVAYLTIL